MDSKFKTIAAIDIGTTKIVAIIGKKDDDGKIEILGIGKAQSLGVKRGVVLNIEDTVNAIEKAVKEAVEKSKIEIEDVYVGIAGQHIKSTRTSGQRYIENEETEISQKDLEILKNDMYKISLEAGEEILHVLPQAYSVDNENGIKHPVGISGKRLVGNFHIVIGKTASINNIKKCINRAGLSVNSLILEPMASAFAVLTKDEKSTGVALVDIGGGTTDIAVFYDGVIRHTSVIPFGGNVITTDIMEGFKILERFAEELKIQYGSALPEMAKDNEVVTIPGISGRPPKEISLKSLAFVINARMKEIIGAISFQIDESGFGKNLGAGIVLTGGGALLHNLTQLFAFETGHDIKIGLPQKYITGEYAEEVNKTIFATSVGLILQGYEEEKYQNIDGNKPKKKSKKRTKKSQKENDAEVPMKNWLKNIGDFFVEDDNKFQDKEEK